jgi:cytochrome c peroxidase
MRVAPVDLTTNSAKISGKITKRRLNMKKLTGLVICGGMVWCSCVVAAELPSLEMGKQLFNSEKLGTSGKSCATCHQDGSKLKGVATYGEDDLADIINNCIAGPLKGKKLDTGSNEMKSLVLYLKSLKSLAATDK